MQHYELSDIVLDELKLHGIKGHQSDTGGGHLQVTWQVVPEKERRTVVVAKTPGDWRARLNTRALVRRFLRADNVALVREPTRKPKEKPKHLQKALEVVDNTIIASTPEQLASMRGEISDLTELVLRLTKIVSSVRETMNTHFPALPEQPAPPPVVPIKHSSRSIKLREYLTVDRPISLDALVRDTGLTLNQIKLKVGYMIKQGEAELFQNRVRLLTAEPKPRKKPGRKPTKVVAMKKPGKTNGHRHAMARQ